MNNVDIFQPFQLANIIKMAAAEAMDVDMPYDKDVPMVYGGTIPVYTYISNGAYSEWRLLVGKNGQYHTYGLSHYSSSPYSATTGCFHTTECACVSCLVYRGVKLTEVEQAQLLKEEADATARK